MENADKTELINSILQLNTNITKDFLRSFSTEELSRYLEDLSNQDLEKVEICY